MLRDNGIHSLVFVTKAVVFGVTVTSVVVKVVVGTSRRVGDSRLDVRGTECASSARI